MIFFSVGIINANHIIVQILEKLSRFSFPRKLVTVLHELQRHLTLYLTTSMRVLLVSCNNHSRCR